MTAPETPTLLDRAAAWRDALATAQVLPAEASPRLEEAIAEARTGRLLNPPPPLLTVMLLGATGGGKSELLNALAGESIAVSHHLRPTTTTPTLYIHADVNPSRLYEYGAELGEMAAQPGTVKIHHREELRNKVIIDAPDIDSYRTEHREKVMRLLPLVDVALYVVTPFSYKDDLGWTLVLNERGRRAFAFVMNKWDAEGRPRSGEGPGADVDFARLVQERAGYANPRLFLTSARRWAAPAEQRAGLPAAGPGENFAELRDWLEQGLSTSRVEQIQRRRRRSLWGALSAAIAGAQPPRIDAAAARQAAIPELQALASEGAAMWRPVIEMRAEALGRRREEEGRPHSPGPFGRLSAGVGAIMNIGRTWKKVAEPRPDATPEDIDAVADRSSTLAARRLSGIEWKLRELHVPAEGLSQSHELFAADLQGRLRATFENASAAILESVMQRWRLVAGWIIIVIFELLTVGLLGLAAWRLVQAFIAGEYLDLRFTLNLLALVAILLAAGSALMAIVFPPVKNRVRRQLESALAGEWRAASDRATVALDRHLETLVSLREEGDHLLKQTNAEVMQITREMEVVDDGETSRLFQGN